MFGQFSGKEEKTYRITKLNESIHDFAPWADAVQRLHTIDTGLDRGVKYHEGKHFTSLSTRLTALLMQMFLLRWRETKRVYQQRHFPLIKLSISAG